MNDPLAGFLRSVRPADLSLEARARVHLDDLTKPRGSLGRLEDVAARLFAIAGGRTPLAVDPAVLVVAAGDHGVVTEGVSPYPQEVTRQMLVNIMAGGAASSVLTRVAGMSMTVVDAGCAGDPVEHSDLKALRLGPGTASLADGPAMSLDDCEKAVLCGAETVRGAVENGARLVATGEMGIGNSTSATALFCAYLGLDPLAVTGPGAGLTPEGVNHKARVVRKALDRHAETVRKAGSPEGALAVLAALGGFEIAVLAGVVAGAAACGLPVLVDGFISTSAFVAARALCPAVADYAFLAHASAEPGYAAVSAALGLDPLLHLGMRLGEGTGCAVALPLLRAAAAVYNDMSTFSGASVTGDMRQPV